MQAIISLIFAPFWVHFILAGLVAVGGFFVQGHDAKIDALRVELAAQPQPIVKPIEAFSRAEGKPSLEEVHLRAQVVPSQSILLQSQDKNGTVTDDAMLYLFYAADAGAETADRTVPLVAYGGVVVPIAQKVMFIDWLMTRYLQGGEAGPLGTIVDLEGMWQSGSSESAARKGMEKYNTKTSKDFFYIQPFYKGRAAGVAYTRKDLKADLIGYFYPALAFLGLGVLKFLWTMARGKKAMRKPEDKTVIMPPVAVEPLVPEIQMAKPLASNDFIGAISARKAAAMAEQAAPAVSGRGLLERLGGSIGGGLKKAAFGFVALVVYLVLVNFDSPFGEPKMIMMTDEVIAQAERARPPATVVPHAVANQPLAAVPVDVSQVASADLLGVAAEWLKLIQAKAQTPVRLAGVAMPIWVFASFLVGMALMALILVSRWAEQKGGKRAEIDPFDRLLQRRQAEKAREAQDLMMGRSALRA